MKFNCGPTYEQKMEAKAQPHKWFAWRPVRLEDGRCAWLEIVERIGTYHSYIDAWWSFNYRALPR